MDRLRSASVTNGNRNIFELFYTLKASINNIHVKPKIKKMYLLEKM